MNEIDADRERRKRFDRVAGVFHQDMYRYATWLSRNPDVAEEVVQEALLRAWKSLDALREDEAAKPWLLTIVRRENARYFERKRLETVDIDNLTPAQSAMLVGVVRARASQPSTGPSVRPIPTRAASRVAEPYI